MKILVTGSDGFIGKNLLERLERMDNIEILTYTRKDSEETLSHHLGVCDFIFHLAGVNRPQDPQDFYTGNRDLTAQIVQILESYGKKTPILLSSSIQAEQENDYGKSKKEAEAILERYARSTTSPVYIYRLPNVFGKWSRPNYNTVIATWCHNIARELPIQISDPEISLRLVYIDDVIDHFLRHLYEEDSHGVHTPSVHPVYQKSLGEINDLLLAFKRSRETLLIPRVGRGFERALYATYLSFLPPERFRYPLKGHQDHRGTFYEILKTIDSGQFSLSTTAPGIARGGHYHNTKNEKFLVVKGEALIRERNIHSDEIVEFRVSDRKMEIVEMVPGYTHDIINTGTEELVLFVWANEVYDPDRPDTYPRKVDT
ncbi:polysaccharide biosynthesis C-terminal domain-containing protein [Hydrogenimonas sp.]